MGTDLPDPHGCLQVQTTDSSVVRIGAWRVDPAVDEICKDGHTVKLERRAMQILMCLARARGQPVSVEELLDHVWAGLVVTPDSVYHGVPPSDASLTTIRGHPSTLPTYRGAATG